MKTIIVADDMAIFRELIEAALNTGGYRVLTASNGLEVLQRARETCPDLILLDLVMPVLDGLGTLRRIRDTKSLAQVPVVVLSAEADREHIVEAATLGISGYVLKSAFSLKLLLDRVESVLGGRGQASPSDPRPDEARRREPSVPAGQPDAAPSPGQLRAADAAQVQGAAQQPRDASQVSVADLKSFRPILSRSELLARLGTGQELTGFSPTVAQVLKLTATSRCSMEDVARAVAQDQAIALKVLKLANSSVYSRPDRIDTVQKAVLRIGMQNIRQAVLNIAVVERFGSATVGQRLHNGMLWEHSIATGIIAAELANALGHDEPDAAFTAGLLHDLGRFLYAERLGDDYTRVLEAAEVTGLPLEQVESRLLLMNHAQVMDHVLHTWGLSKQLVNPIMHHHAEPEQIRVSAPHQAIEVLRLSLADRLAHALMIGSSGNETVYSTADHCRLLGVSPAMIAHIEQHAAERAEDAKFALLSHSSENVWPRRVDAHRACLSAPFVPLFVGAAPEIDAYRIICGQLAARPVGAEPTIVIVHIGSVKERRRVSEILGERHPEASGLPRLILSPGATLDLDDSVPAAPSQRMATPTPIPSFVAAINSLLETE